MPIQMNSLLIISFAGAHFRSIAEFAFVGVNLVVLVFFAVCVLYLVILLLAAVPLRGRVTSLAPGEKTGIATAAIGQAGSPRLALLLPAHNEEMVLDAALKSLGGIDYPADRFRIVVIADNCTDRTAEIAAANGAVVLTRFNDLEIGKGYALEWALKELFAAGARGDFKLVEIADFDGIVVLDADTLVSPNLLTAFAAGLARGEKAMQVRYEVLNSGDSWRTKLMSCALALVHIVKPLGREHLELSDGLKGNGMCFARNVVESVPWSGASITEDIEYTLRLCRAGYRVAFLPDAAVWAQMPVTGAQAASQRQRWEGGRYQLLFGVAPRLVMEALRKRSLVLLDRGMELIIPPFAEMFAIPLVFLALCGTALGLTGWPWAAGLAWAWIAILGLQAGYLFGGLWVARVPRSVAISVLAAPIYIVWKFGLYAVMAVGRSAGGWKRTERRKI